MSAIADHMHEASLSELRSRPRDWDALLSAVWLWVVVFLAFLFGGGAYFYAMRNDERIAEVAEKTENIAELSARIDQTDRRADQIGGQILEFKRSLAEQTLLWPGNSLSTRIADIESAVDRLGMKLNQDFSEETAKADALEARVNAVTADISGMQLRLNNAEDQDRASAAKLTELSTPPANRVAQTAPASAAGRWIAPTRTTRLGLRAWSWRTGGVGRP
jgi:hypothetical protein